MCCKKEQVKQGNLKQQEGQTALEMSSCISKEAGNLCSEHNSDMNCTVSDISACTFPCYVTEN